MPISIAAFLLCRLTELIRSYDFLTSIVFASELPDLVFAVSELRCHASCAHSAVASFAAHWQLQVA